MKGDVYVKKNGRVVRDRQAEAFRMAVGLTLDDDEVNVFVMDNKVDVSDEAVSLNVETCNDLDVKIILTTLIIIRADEHWWYWPAR